MYHSHAHSIIHTLSYTVSHMITWHIVSSHSYTHIQVSYTHTHSIILIHTVSYTHTHSVNDTYDNVTWQACPYDHVTHKYFHHSHTQYHTHSITHTLSYTYTVSTLIHDDHSHSYIIIHTLSYTHYHNQHPLLFPFPSHSSLRTCFLYDASIWLAIVVKLSFFILSMSISRRCFISSESKSYQWRSDHFLYTDDTL